MSVRGTVHAVTMVSTNVKYLYRIDSTNQEKLACSDADAHYIL